MSRELIQQYPKHVILPLEITSGGTNAKTAQEALENLGGLSLALKGQPNGITPLNNNRKIPLTHLPSFDVNSVSVTGPSYWFIGRSAIFTITDYDFDTQYNVASSDGQITIVKDIITFTPNSLGMKSFTIQGVTYHLDVRDLPIPNITFPVNDAIDVYSPTEITASLNLLVMDPEHIQFAFAEWELSTDLNFTNIVSTETIALTDQDRNTFTFRWSPNLNVSTAYWVRVRIKDSSTGVTAWSNVVHFTTNALRLPIQLSSRFLVNTVANTQTSRLSDAVAISGDGNILAVTDYGNQEVEIYKNINHNWVFQTSLSPPTIPDYDLYINNFGYYLTLSTTGDILLIGNPGLGLTAVGTGTGAIHRFETTTPGDFASYNYQSTVHSHTPQTQKWFGNKFKSSNDGNRLFASNNNTTVEIFEYVVDHYEYITTIADPEPIHNNGLSMFGLYYNFDINSSGTRLIVNDVNWLVSDLSATGGCVNTGRTYIFDLIEGNWISTGIIEVSDPATNYTGSNNFFISSKSHITNDGNTIFIGMEREQHILPQDDFYYYDYLYVYTNVNNVWTYQQRIENPDWINGSFNDGYIESIAFSDNGHTLIIGSADSNSANLQNVGITNINDANGNTGTCWLYINTGSSWELLHRYDGPYKTLEELNIGPRFGSNILFNQSDNSVIIFAPSMVYTGSQYIGGTINGEILVYR